MQNEPNILSALQKAVTAAVAASDTPALPVKYLLKSFSIPNDQKWLELVWLPNNDRNSFLGQEQNHRGIFRLVLHWPNTAGDVYQPTRLLESICKYFENGRVLSNVQVVGMPTTTGIIEDGDDVLFPVSIYYQSYRKGA